MCFKLLGCCYIKPKKAHGMKITTYFILNTRWDSSCGTVVYDAACICSWWMIILRQWENDAGFYPSTDKFRINQQDGMLWILAWYTWEAGLGLEREREEVHML